MKMAALPVTPSQRTAIGIQAIGAMERSESMIGDIARSTSRDVPSNKPNATPNTTAKQKASRTRVRLWETAIASVPSATMRTQDSRTPTGRG